ncbi:MAG: FHA domain-containing protein [Myxococcales bacterium]|jgi:hypothetical protein|nr:FHA domain-containing protein [Myxococcales bacterium]
MKTSKNTKTSHQIRIADSIWSAFEQMADEMGADREGLINQAMFTFARLNGFLLAPAATGTQAAIHAPAEASDADADRDEPDAPALAEASEDEEEAEFQSEFDADMDFVADEPEALAEADDESGEFLSEDSPPPPPVPSRRPISPPPSRRAGASLPPPSRSRRFSKEPEPEPEPEADEFDAAAQGELNDRKAVAERVLETAAELERLIKGKGAGSGESVDEEDLFDPENTPVGKPSNIKARAGGALELYLVDEVGELELIEKARYIIGRGKHCDMVINSGKVSREHAVISKENGGFFIEDLGSSNGTWFKKQRIKKQQIEDGDEFYVCAEKVKFALR